MNDTEVIKQIRAQRKLDEALKENRRAQEKQRAGMFYIGFAIGNANMLLVGLFGYWVFT